MRAAHAIFRPAFRVAGLQSVVSSLERLGGRDLASGKANHSLCLPRIRGALPRSGGRSSWIKWATRYEERTRADAEQAIGRTRCITTLVLPCSND
jgi:hypothetical protein